MANTNPTRHLIDIAQWHKMGEAGVFENNQHIELIDGEILTMSQMGFNHAGHVKRLNSLFAPLVVFFRRPVV